MGQRWVVVKMAFQGGFFGGNSFPPLLAVPFIFVNLGHSACKKNFDKCRTESSDSKLSLQCSWNAVCQAQKKLQSFRRSLGKGWVCELAWD